MSNRSIPCSLVLSALLMAGCSGSSGSRCPTEGACPEAGVTECADGQVRTCAADADGCLAWDAPTACASGACLDAIACLECDHACSDGQSECAAGQVRTCTQDGDGCRIWGEFTDCPEGFCQDAATCGTCADPCSDGQTECTGGLLRACEVDANGCRVWGAASQCPDGFCQDAVTCGTCDDACAQGQAECVDGDISACEQDEHGCWRMSAPSVCPDGWCLDATTCGVCDNACDADGQTECTGAQERTCQAVEHGCLDWTGFSACGLGYCASDTRCGWLTTDESVVLADDGAPSEAFGNAVAISADTMVVGVAADNNANGNGAGAVYVFERDQGGPDAWGQVAKLVPADGAAMDQFGTAVAIDGDVVVVGAPYDGDNGLQAGSAYVYERDQGGPGAWGQVTKLLAADGGEYDAFGWTVSVSGDIIAVGAVFDGTFGTATGSVYLFERDNGGPDAWGQQLKIHSASPSQDYFAQSVAISGDTLVVGAYKDDELDTDAGAAYVFERDNGGADNWGQVTKILAPDGAHSDQFGNAVAIDADLIVVGAPEDEDLGSRSGSAYLFDRDQGGVGAWGLVEKLHASDGSEDAVFGFCVAISDENVLVGAPYVGSGSAYLFQPDPVAGATWEQAIELSTSLRFGFSVSASADTLAVGAVADTNQNGSAAGAVYVYQVAP